ncbi:MAG: EamA family transporter, partial [Candidatus Aenigmarchaeota archaeon]|nr:EamA family transporter [Candidatus Aenigmarchaeota archaeon]
ALLFWGFGDFLIQKSTRKFGDWETLFSIVAFGTIILTPLVYNDLWILSSNENLLVLMAASLVLLGAALLDFEALKKGKIAVVEPVYALEVPIAAVLAFGIISETVELLEISLISILIIGLIMVSLRSHHFSRRAWVERGVFLAAVGSLFMGSANFLVGFAARITNPLMSIWFTNLVLTFVCLYYLMINKKLGGFARDFYHHRKLVLGVAVLDNLAWIAFAGAMSIIPIVIAVALSESYIALAALLGLLINKERLFMHQKIGLFVVLLSAVALAGITA